MSEKFSDSIDAFADLVCNAQKEYVSLTNEIKDLEHRTQDYLHELEFGELDYKGRAKLATQLSNVRKERRKCKDRQEVIWPLVRWAGNDKLLPLRDVLGETRKMERQHEARTYNPWHSEKGREQ